MRENERPACPGCGRRDAVIPMIFGLPDEDLMRLAEKGEVALGGCCLPPNPPDCYCADCELSFRGG